MQRNYAKRMDRMKASEIRELLKLTTKPEIISFAGGLPAPELFPVEDIAKVAHDLVLKEGRLQGVVAGKEIGFLREPAQVDVGFAHKVLRCRPAIDDDAVEMAVVRHACGQQLAVSKVKNVVARRKRGTIGQKGNIADVAIGIGQRKGRYRLLG